MKYENNVGSYCMFVRFIKIKSMCWFLFFFCDLRINFVVVCLVGNLGYNRKKMVNVENDVYDYGVMILIDLDLIILMIYEFVLF